MGNPPEAMFAEVKADFRSVCRLFWNQTVTDRSSLYMAKAESNEQTRVISEPGIHGAKIRRRQKVDVQIAFVREILALFSGRVAGFVE